MNLAITKNRGEHITRPRRRANVSRVGPAAVPRPAVAGASRRTLLSSGTLVVPS
jgi:hypothetical protein